MPYCSSEQKLQGFDEPEVEIQDEDCQGGEYTATVHINRPCASCGTEAGYYDLDVSEVFEHECPVQDGAPEGHRFAMCPEHLDLNKEGQGATGCEACDQYVICLNDDCNCAEDPEFELESSDVNPVDDYQRTDRHGKPIKNPRYQRHLIGAEVTATIACQRCGESFDVVATDSVPASSFEVESSH